jgi:hypothetical protein
VPGRVLCLVLGTCVLVAASCTVEGPTDDDEGSGASSSGSGPGPTELCQEACAAQDPSGQDAYLAVRGCLLCGACADICKGQDGGTCVNGAVEAGCSAMFTTCEECVNSACALYQRPEDLFYEGVCFEYGNGCSADLSCVAFNNCVSSCVANGGGAGGGVGVGGAGGTM